MAWNMRLLARRWALSNWPFAAKLAFGPALAMFILLGLGAVSIYATDGQATLIRAVARHELEIAVRLSRNAADLQTLNGRVYRLATLLASKAPNLNVTDEIAKLASQAAAISEALVGERQMISSEEDRRSVDRLVSELKTYRDAIDVFGSILELDFASAIDFIQPFDENAGNLLKDLNGLVRHTTEDATREAKAASDIAGRTWRVVVLTTIFGGALLFGVSAMLTRWTVASVRQIAAATASVAKGGTTVDIGALERNDELGTIVRSLAVFQANIAQIAFLAHHDPLTRLPNRVLFHERAQQALAHLDRNQTFAIFCLDLDRFKAVNDTLGHPVGDGLLREVADRLRACVREGDTVARLGGDEFAVVLPRVSEAVEADQLARRVIRVLSSTYDVDGNQISIGCSIGIALAPVDGVTSHELLKNADTALYGAKSAGRGTACFYEPAMNEALQTRRQFEVGLRRAIENQEFQLYYQPLVDAQSHSLIGFEALIRWIDPEHGLIPPDRFISIAESCGLISEIGRWTLRQACLDAASWPDECKIAVNLSPLQFKDKDLIENIRTALAESGLQPNRLEIEITESVLMTDSDKILAILNKIKDLGVRISMDDFGTGYSSLSYLRTFPFDKIKIDRSFIKDLAYDANSRAIVRAVVGLSQTFGMSVTAEGVETEEQARQLAIENCTHLQGYLFSRPVPAAELSNLLEQLARSASRKAGASFVA